LRGTPGNAPASARVQLEPGPDPAVWFNLLLGISRAFCGEIVLFIKPAMQCGNPQTARVLNDGCGMICRQRRPAAPLFRGALLFVLALAFGSGTVAISMAQTRPGDAADGKMATSATPKAGLSAASLKASAGALEKWEGLPVRHISFKGIEAAKLAPLPEHLAQTVGKPLRQEQLRESLRQLFATGLYNTLDVEGQREDGGVDLTFLGTPRPFIGRVGVYGAKGPTVNTQLESAAQLSPGTRFTEAKLKRAMTQMRQTLAQDGYYQPVIEQKLTRHPAQQLVDVVFHVTSGPQARVGSVEVAGDSGMSVSKFRHVAHLRSGSHVNRDTVSRALAGALKHYQRHNRMEAEIKLESEQYVPATKKVDFRFSVNRGPVVIVQLEGASMEQDDLQHLIPIYEEGTVDEDLLNEGNRRLRDYYERLGYFDVKVEHREESPRSGFVEINYTVHLGQRRKVAEVEVKGNHYFDSATLKGLLRVHAASTLDRHGAYSQALVSTDVNSLESVYQNNGFANVKVTPHVSSESTGAEKHRKQKGPAPLRVAYNIDEGKQVRVGKVRIEGNKHIPNDELTLLMNTVPGQLLSPRNLGGDRNALLAAYLRRGFDRVKVGVVQTPEKAAPGKPNPHKMDVTFNITEGPQTFVHKVLVSGLHYTRPSTVKRAITVRPGEPLDLTALTETQRNLYDYGLFNQVNVAVQNPTGAQIHKSVLVQTTEARRWTLTYGFGFEAQTGQPEKNCKGEFLSGIPCSPAGKTGVSPRVLADITRNNILGRDESVSLRGTYGLLEQSANLLFQVPHFEGNRNLSLTFSGGYANSQDVTTYVASRLESGIRWTQTFQTPGSRFSRANTFVYEYDFRRVKVAASSLQVCPCDLTQLSTATRVAGPSFTWIRDTRDSPLNAHRGTYTSFQDFLSVVPLGGEAEFNRIDVSNSSYYSFDKGRFVLARNTRYGQVRAFGAPENELIPLPERLYAGGALSLRAFSQNAAGPRDPETGYPVGGAGTLYNQTELRLPPPSLPWLGNSLSLVIFHDMGNVFTNAGDAWASIFRVHQPDRNACKVLATVGDPSTYDPTGPVTSTGPQGQCSFNYFSHAPGIGLRYHTPIGPLRLDFSYNLNPPIFPVNIDYSLADPASDPHVGEAGHFNFFFSFGQAF